MQARRKQSKGLKEARNGRSEIRILHFTRSFGSATHSVGSTLRVWAWVGEGQGVGVGGTIQQKGDNFLVAASEAQLWGAAR
jgi:hypothetical protein